MLKSFSSALKGMFSAPGVLLPAAVAALVNAVILFFSLDVFSSLVFGIFILDNVPLVGFAELPFRLFFQYQAEFLMLGLAVLAGFLIQLVLLFFYSRVAVDADAKKASFGNAWKETMKNSGKILSVFVFFSVLGFFALLATVFLLVNSIAFGLIGGFILLVWLAAIAYITVKLAFVVPSMAADKAKLKDALKKSWAFSNKGFFSVLAFLLGLWIINALITRIVFSGIDVLGEDLAVIAVIFIVSLVLSAFNSLSVAFYYIKRR